MSDKIAPSDAEIERIAEIVERRLNEGSPNAQQGYNTDVNTFSAVLCDDGKIRLTQWYNDGINTSGVMLSDAIANKGVSESRFCSNEAVSKEGAIRQMQDCRREYF